MAYDGRVLRQATLRFDEDKQRRQEQQRQRQQQVYASIRPSAVSPRTICRSTSSATRSAVTWP